MAWYDKGSDYWAAWLGVAIYMALRNADRAPILRRILKLGSSTLLGASLSEPVAAMFGAPETLVMVFLVVGAHLVLDLVMALLSDRALIADIVRGRMGGGRNG
ncbi:hypothetical protein [Mameliella alba]|uniref:hypothetical protein n=1 Tax=Mameliella alba TaxID=561184 RepID=UPI00087ED661|nr:hypothetical protein [Mameliella alba]OWV39392.1 hypothetical protein CDZ95_26045 [Mameliella alba]OWV46496.1 hypothetical protein CDZ96_17960 [Mameliella alba]PTR37308.1 hypothetical protein LX94_03647 [Mameliella alba]SDD76129.1 hypothetical protein SAMN05216376_111116 [Mameliella alba]GGF73694.1 hypothetical protein GCM10011319_37790 [Mameliella alba]